MSDNLLKLKAHISRRPLISAITLTLVITTIIALGILSLQGLLPIFTIITSYSMYPTLKPGDLLMVYYVNPENIEIGDIIAFKYVVYETEEGLPTLHEIPLTVHRVVDIIRKNGKLYFKTKGDFNPEPDPWLVPADKVLGKIEKIASLGRLGLVLVTPIGKILLLILLTSAITLLASIIWSSEKNETRLKDFL